MEKTIILDLDETLVHTFEFPSYYDLASKNPVLAENLYSFTLDGEVCCGMFRPLAREFVYSLCENFNVGVWSAGVSDYVEKIVSLLFGKLKPSFVYSRLFCDEMTYIEHGKPTTIKKKPLTKIYLQHPPLNRKNCIIIDDREDVSSENSECAIIVPNFTLPSLEDSSGKSKKLADKRLLAELEKLTQDDTLLRLGYYLIDNKDVSDFRKITSPKL